jgi:hypothetical protein
MFRRSHKCEWQELAYVNKKEAEFLKESLHRVRELADKFEKEPATESLSYNQAGNRIIIAMYRTGKN